MAITTLLVFVILICVAFYLCRFIPDTTVQGIIRIVLIVGAALWVVRNLDGLLHCCTGL